MVCRRDGLTICAFTARVVARCIGCPIAHKVRFCLSFGLGLSEVRGNYDRALRLRRRVIVLTQYATVWPKVLTGGSSVRSTYSLVDNRR